MELHYLFVSRRSLLLPYLSGEDEYAYLAASDHHTLVRIDTIDKRLRHLGTSREEMRIKFGIEFPYSKVNNIKEQEDFLQKIFIVISLRTYNSGHKNSCVCCWTISVRKGCLMAKPVRLWMWDGWVHLV